MTPLERAARDLAKALGGDFDESLGGEIEWKEDYMNAVRAVLLAIREPSEGMVKSFVDQALHGDVLSHGGWQGYAKDQWRAMIDKALEEG